MSSNEIVKQKFLKAPRSIVWRALTDSREFGSWFGMKLDGPFEVGKRMKGSISPTTVDPEVAKLQKPYEGTPAEFVVGKIVPETRFELKWHPFAVDPKVDYSKEEMTLIAFTLEEKDGGVLLTVRESGFEKIPASRREEAMKSNDGGWAHQMELISKYLAR